MTILPEDRKTIDKNVFITGDHIMVKSDHFPKESSRRNYNEKREVDLSRPLTAGAFVDAVKMKELHDTLSRRLPPGSPLAWLLAEKDESEENMREVSLSEGGAVGGCAVAVAGAPSRAVDVPAPDARRRAGLTVTRAVLDKLDVHRSRRSRPPAAMFLPVKLMYASRIRGGGNIILASADRPSHDADRPAEVEVSASVRLFESIDTGAARPRRSVGMRPRAG